MSASLKEEINNSRHKQIIAMQILILGFFLFVGDLIAVSFFFSFFPTELPPAMYIIIGLTWIGLALIIYAIHMYLGSVSELNKLMYELEKSEEAS